MIGARSDVLSGTPDEIADMLDELSRPMELHEYLAGTRLRTLAIELAGNPALSVSVVTYENGSQELDVKLAGSSDDNAVVVGRSADGTSCMITRDQWMNIETAPEIQRTAGFITALLTIPDTTT